MAVGLRGAWQKMNYDLFIGAPLWKPEGFRTGRYTVGFSTSVSF